MDLTFLDLRGLHATRLDHHHVAYLRTAMIPLSERSIEQLLSLADTLHLLSHHRTLDRFVSLSTGTRTYVFDNRLARTFLLWLIGGEIEKTGGTWR